MTQGYIAMSRSGSVGVLEITNAEQRNALTPDMLTEIKVCLQSLEASEDCRVVILRGSNGIFSSGYAIDHIGPGNSLPYPDVIDITCQALEKSPLPVVAVLEGYVVGAAVEVAAACDFRLAAPDTIVGITPAKLGLVYSWTGVARIARIVGFNRAREMFLTAELYDSETATNMGFFSQAAESLDDLERAVRDLSLRLQTLAPMSLAGTKRILFELSAASAIRESVSLELHELRVLAMDSKDAAEARDAFAAKRRPTFRNR